jgi:hypothetical protein
MFYLCTVESNQMQTVFGGPVMPMMENIIPPKYTDLQVIMIGQKIEEPGILTSCLLLSNIVVDEFVKHDSIPEGYDFIFRQAWGLTINESIIHRVIETLRAESYPPMADYLDGLVKNDSAQIEKYIASCNAVKEKYPKFSF